MRKSPRPGAGRLNVLAGPLKTVRGDMKRQRQPEFQVSPKAAFLANTIDTLTARGYRGVLQIAIALNEVVGARLIHTGADGKQVSLDVPIEDVEGVILREQRKPNAN
jgi:hypothetical protein